MRSAEALLRAAAPALICFGVLAVVGALAMLAHKPWLFPSLGPTIFLLAVGPDEPAARPRNVFLGHAIGAAAGFAAIYLCGAQTAPSVFEGQGLAPSRAAATAVAVGLTLFFQTLANARHPPAAATTMLLTLGAMPPGAASAAAIAAGVTLTAGGGYAVQALRRPRAAIPWRARPE